MPKLDRDIAAETQWSDFEDISADALCQGVSDHHNPTFSGPEPPVLPDEPSPVPVDENPCPEPGLRCEEVQLSPELYAALSDLPLESPVTEKEGGGRLGFFLKSL